MAWVKDISYISPDWDSDSTAASLWNGEHIQQIIGGFFPTYRDRLIPANEYFQTNTFVFDADIKWSKD